MYRPRKNEKLTGGVTFNEQLSEAYKLLIAKGREAVDNPHGMIGRTCHCGSCFCCAAAQIVAEYDAR